MHLLDQIPISVLDVLERDIPQNSGIIDQDVDGSKRLYGSFDDLLSKLYGIVAGDRFAARFFDLFNDDICSLYCPSVSP